MSTWTSVFQRAALSPLNQMFLIIFLVFKYKHVCIIKNKTNIQDSFQNTEGKKNPQINSWTLTHLIKECGFIYFTSYITLFSLHFRDYEFSSMKGKSLPSSVPEPRFYLDQKQ